MLECTEANRRLIHGNWHMETDNKEKRKKMDYWWIALRNQILNAAMFWSYWNVLKFEIWRMLECSETTGMFWNWRLLECSEATGMFWNCWNVLKLLKCFWDWIMVEYTAATGMFWNWRIENAGIFWSYWNVMKLNNTGMFWSEATRMFWN